MFITHDLRLAAQICDDIIVLYAGRAVEHGPARARAFGARRIPIRAACSSPNPPMSAARGARSMCCPTRCRACARCRTWPAAISRRAVRSPTHDCRTPRRRRSRSGPAACAACIRAAGDARHRDAAEPAAARTAARRDRSCRSRTLGKHYAAGRGLLRPRADFAAVTRRRFTLAENEFVGAGRRKRQRQEHARRDAGRAGAAERRRASSSTARDVTARIGDAPARCAPTTCRWCSRTRNRRSIRAAASARIITQAMEAGSRHASRRGEARAGARAARARSACRRKSPRAFRRSSPAASASASTSRARSAPCRRCWSPTRSSPGSTCRCRRSS